MDRLRSGSRTKPGIPGQQGTLTRIWAKRGSRPRAQRDRRFCVGVLMLAPFARLAGIGVAVVMPEVGIDAA